MRRNLFLILSLILVLAISGCGTAKLGEEAQNLEPTKPAQNSNGKVTEPNQMTALAHQLGITHEEYPRIDGSTSTFGIVRGINSSFYVYEQNDNYPMGPLQTVPSYYALMDGKLDMILVPSASTTVLERAQEIGVELEFYPIAAEALIFITPAENTASNITMEQVQDIYLRYGIRNWSQLGGPNRELVPISRNADSGSQSQMDNLILKDQEMHQDIRKNYVELTMEGMLEQVAFYHQGGLSGKPSNSYALGYTLFTYLKNIGDITGIDTRLKILSFNGVEPTQQNIADGTYPLADYYYAVVRKDLPPGHSARKIISWLQSSEGQEIIRNLNLIPVEDFFKKIGGGE